MAYNDELGEVLDSIGESELKNLACDVLKVSEKKFNKTYKELGISGIRHLCSKELRCAGGHSLVNCFRDEHQLPYKDIVIDVAKDLKIKFDKENDNVEEIEKKIIDNMIKESWKKMDEREENEIVTEIQTKIAHQKIEKKIAKKIGKKIIKEMINHTEYGANIATSVLGYNILQTVIFKVMLEHMGVIVATKSALGFGLGGVALKASGYIVPGLQVVAALQTLNWVMSPATRKTIPAVVTIALYRIENQAQESNENELNIWETLISIAFLSLLLYWLFN